MIPVEIQEEVELWAREQGRHAKIVWNPLLRCPEVQIDLKAEDPRLKKWQAQTQKVPNKPVESVFLHRHDGHHYVALNLGELGASGVRALLEEGNMWAGRGQAPNLLAAVRMVDEKNERVKEAMRKEARDNSRDRAREHRREILDLPLVSVPADLE